MGRRTPTYPCPFAILADSNEYIEQHNGWRFEGLRTNADLGNRPITVDVTAGNLDEGDYAIAELPGGIIVERKAHADLVQSMSTAKKRANFEERLALMEQGYRYSCVVCEADWHTILTRPPAFSGFNPKAVIRTVMAWDQRFGTSWWFMPDRASAEACAFRLMERFWIDRMEEKKEIA